MRQSSWDSALPGLGAAESTPPGLGTRHFAPPESNTAAAAAATHGTAAAAAGAAEAGGCGWKSQEWWSKWYYGIYQQKSNLMKILNLIFLKNI